jgi:vacuolar-type H+-ATPase subunit H
MKNNSQRRQSVTSEEAMNRVLQAEKDAAKALSECEQNAEVIISAAQNRAQRIAERTNERIALLRMQCTECVAREIRAMRRVEDAVRTPRSSYELEDASIAAAVAAVAAYISGEHEDPANEGDMSV